MNHPVLGQMIDESPCNGIKSQESAGELMLFAGQLAVEARQGDAEGLQRAHGVPDQSKRGFIRLTNQKEAFLS
jgi:hypothetical protein